MQQHAPREASEDVRAPAKGAARDLSPAHAHAVALNRALGNRAATALLQRYTTTVNYGVQGTGALVQKQWIKHTGPYEAPSYRQTRIDAGAGGAITQTHRSYDLNAAAVGPGPQGAWVDDAAGASATTKPALNVSSGGELAVAADGHPTTFFATAGAFTRANTALANEGAMVRLRWTNGPAIDVNGRQLDQASVEEVKATGPTGRVATQLAAECSDLAAKVAGYDSVLDDKVQTAQFGAQANEAAAPSTGRVYAFQSAGDANAGFDDLMPTKEKALARELDRIIAGWVEAEVRMTRGQGIGHIDPKSRGLLAGWGNHFETVVAVDGNDTVTLANYNRALGPGEVLMEKRRLFRALYLRNAWFRRVFIEKCLADAQAQRKLKRSFDWARIFFAIDSAFAEAQQNGPADVKAAIADFDRFRATANRQSDFMWYFDMYEVGDAAKSFHGRYKPSGRGAATMTRVYPKPGASPPPAAPAAAPVAAVPPAPAVVGTG